MVNPKSFGQFTMMHHDLPSLIFEQSLIFPVVFMHQGLKWQFFVTCARRKFLLNLFSHRIWHAFSNLTRKLYRNYDQKALIRRTGLLSWVLVARIFTSLQNIHQKRFQFSIEFWNIHCVMETAHQGIMQRRRRISSRRWDDNLSSQCVTTMRCLMIDSDCFLRVFQLSWGDPHFFLKKCCAGGASWVPWIPAFDTLCFQASGSTNLSVPKIWGVEALVIRG